MGRQRDPCFTPKLESSGAEGMRRWVWRDGRFHRAALLCPFSHGQWQKDRICAPIPGLPKNIGVVPDTRDNMGYCSLAPRQRTTGWLRPGIQGGGQQHCPSPPLSQQERWKASLPATSALCIQLGEREALFVYNSSCSRAPCFHRRPQHCRHHHRKPTRGHSGGRMTSRTPLASEPPRHSVAFLLRTEPGAAAT